MNEVLFLDNKYEKLASLILNYYKKNAIIPRPEVLLTHIEDMEITNLLSDILLFDEPLIDLNETIYSLKESFYEKSYQTMKEEIANSNLSDTEKANKLNYLKKQYNLNIVKLKELEKE